MTQELRANIEAIKHNAPRMIWVTFTKEGIHKYPRHWMIHKSGDEYDVSCYPHRHTFRQKH